MEIQCFTVGQFRVTTYLISDPVTNYSAIVDPGESRELILILNNVDRPLFDLLPQQANCFGMPMFNRACGRIDQMLDDGDEITIGSLLKLTFLSTPGHTPGQGCYYDDLDIIASDTLFTGSIGRTDLPMSDRRIMNDSLRRLFQLPKHLRVHSGHVPVATLGHEFLTNPFLKFLREENDLS